MPGDGSEQQAASPPSPTSICHDPNELWITIRDTQYNVTDFVARHPGGSVINYMLANAGADATEVFDEMHYRSRRARRVLMTLPSRPFKTSDSERLQQNDGRAATENVVLLKRFAEWRSQLESEGFFEPSPMHVAYRLAELVAIFVAGLYFFSIRSWAGLVVAVLLHGLFGARCGWVQHEGGHCSLTGNMWLDKRIQAMTIGFGLGACSAMWNSMHNKHHATPQKVGHDLDLDTTPLAAFYPTAVETNRPRGFSRLWARFQAYTFLPFTSGVFVMAFWLLFLHPRECFRKGLVEQLGWMLASHLGRTALIAQATGWGYAASYGAFACCMWCSGVYLFGHFSLSHTHLATVNSMDHPTCARLYS